MNQKNFAIIVLVVVIVVLASAVGYFVMVRKSTPIAQQLPTPTLTPTQTQTSVSQTPTLTPTQTATGKIVDATGYYVDDFLKQNKSISSANVDFIKKLTSYEKLIDAWGRHYASISIVKDGADENIIYFGGEAIYSLNLQTNTLREIYNQGLNLIGRQGNKLLFEKIDPMDSPGPCYNIWVYAYEHPLPRPKSKYPNQDDSRTIKSLDLNNPSVGFSDFIVPKEKYNSEKIEETTCIQAMENR